MDIPSLSPGALAVPAGVMRLIILDVPDKVVPQLMALMKELFPLTVTVDDVPIELDKAIEIDIRELIVDVPEHIDTDKAAAMDALGQLLRFCNNSGLLVIIPPTPKPH